MLSTSPLPGRSSRVPNVVIEDFDTLPLRLRTAVESSLASVPVVRLQLPFGLDYDGSFTTGDAQTFAVMLLDAICTAYDE